MRTNQKNNCQSQKERLLLKGLLNELDQSFPDQKKLFSVLQQAIDGIQSILFPSPETTDCDSKEISDSKETHDSKETYDNDSEEANDSEKTLKKKLKKLIKDLEQGNGLSEQQHSVIEKLTKFYIGEKFINKPCLAHILSYASRQTLIRRTFFDKFHLFQKELQLLNPYPKRKRQSNEMNKIVKGSESKIGNTGSIHRLSDDSLSIVLSYLDLDRVLKTCLFLSHRFYWCSLSHLILRFSDYCYALGGRFPETRPASISFPEVQDTLLSRKECQYLCQMNKRHGKVIVYRHLYEAIVSSRNQSNPYGTPAILVCIPKNQSTQQLRWESNQDKIIHYIHGSPAYPRCTFQVSKLPVPREELLVVGVIAVSETRFLDYKQHGFISTNPATQQEIEDERGIRKMSHCAVM